jgi:hypothetical protein
VREKGEEMIRVTIEMLPGGVDMGPGENEILGVMLLANDLSATLKSKGTRGTYQVRLWKKRNAANVIAANQLGSGFDYSPNRQAEVENFPRNSYHVWNLVWQALDQLRAVRPI